MAAYDIFELTLHGYGGHGAMPNETIDPIMIASEVIGALQTIASRTVQPVDSAVVSVTQVHGADAWNVILPEVVLRVRRGRSSPMRRTGAKPASEKSPAACAPRTERQARCATPVSRDRQSSR